MEVHSTTALNRMTVAQLKDVAKEQGLTLPDKALKKNLVELVRSKSANPADVTSVKETAETEKPTKRATAKKAIEETAGTTTAPVATEENESVGRQYGDMVTDAFGYISPATVNHEFQAHYRIVSWVLAVELFTMLIFPFPGTSEEMRTYDPYVQKLNSPAFHQGALHWLVFLCVLPLVAAAVIADRKSGSAYATLIFALARYLVVYLEVPVIATTFQFLPMKLFTATCGVLGVLSFWSHTGYDDFDVDDDFSELDWLTENEEDDDEE